MQSEGLQGSGEGEKKNRGREECSHIKVKLPDLFHYLSIQINHSAKLQSGRIAWL